MLSYQSYLKGNTVIGVSIQHSEVSKAQALLNGYLGISTDRLRFRQGSLYNLDFDDGTFDEIICTEVLEHLCDDESICRTFWRILKPGGVLHITTPNARHPYNEKFPLDSSEMGGHVRPGYTLESYRALLEPIGFEIEKSAGLGGPVRQAFNWRIKEIQMRRGAAAGLPLFLISLPCLLCENTVKEREMPFSIYVKAVK
jgi:SAM-dependent methyltransferase